jgi:MFS family permease
LVPPDSAITKNIRRRLPFSDSVQSLRERPFRRWFFGQVLSASGTSIQNVGQAWLIVELGGSGLDLGLASGALFLPCFLFGIYGGSLADRFTRRKILLVTQCLQALTAATLAALTATHLITVPAILLLALATGLVRSADEPARQTYVVDLVGTAQIRSAVALNEVVITCSRMIGPAIGGLLIAFTPIWFCFMVNALSFMITISVLLSQRHLTSREVRTADEELPLRDAFACVRREGSIRACLALGAVSGALYNSVPILPVLASHVFHVGGLSYGLMLTSFGLGALPGALLAGTPTTQLNRSVRRLALASGGAALLVATSPVVGFVYPAMMLLGLCVIALVARSNSLLMLRTPPGLRGRMMGIWSMAVPGCNAFTGLLTGTITSSWGPRQAFVVAGALVLAALAVGWRTLQATARQDDATSARQPLDDPQAIYVQDIEEAIDGP